MSELLRATIALHSRSIAMLEDEIERLENELENDDEIERLQARVDELEAEVKALWLEKIERDNVADSELEEWKDSCDPGVDTAAVDGYCGKRSSKAGLQAGETEHE